VLLVPQIGQNLLSLALAYHVCNEAIFMPIGGFAMIYKPIFTLDELKEHLDGAAHVGSILRLPP